MMKLLVSVEGFHSLFEWASVLLLALTFIAAAGTVITSRIINQRQAEKILGLEKSATDAKADQQKVEKSLAEALTRQSEAEKSLLEVKSKLSYRSIEPAKRLKIIEGIKAFAPQTFDVIWYVDDAESTSFANELFRIAIAAGWTPMKSESFLALSLEFGVQVDIIESKRADFGATANALASELTKAGVDDVRVKVWPDEQSKDIPDRIRIRVGKKPR